MVAYIQRREGDVLAGEIPFERIDIPHEHLTWQELATVETVNAAYEDANDAETMGEFAEAWLAYIRARREWEDLCGVK
jgi:hypothetical protein